MDKQQGLAIVEGLRAAQAAGAPVVELHGDAARNFAFVKDEARKVLLGSFGVEVDKPFFVVVVSTPRSDDGFQFIVYEKLGGTALLVTSELSGQGIVWTYQAGKQDGNNALRKRAFVDAAKAEALTLPVPTRDIKPFSAAVTRALELRKLAHAAGDVESAGTWQPPAPVLPPRKVLPATRHGTATVPGVVWQLCATGPGATLAELQRAIDVLGLGKEHPARGMLSGFAKRYGCTVTVQGSGPNAIYGLVPPNEPVAPGVSPASRSDDDDELLDDEMAFSLFTSILDHLRTRSLSFSAEVVASFLLALQAKRFVLLTGISGTGKTRLAQEVARLCGPKIDTQEPRNDDRAEMVAKPYQHKYSRFVVPSELAQEFDALTDPSINRVDLKVPGLPVASMALYKRPDGSNLFYVTLSGEVRAWFKANLAVGDRFLLARRTSGDKEWLELTLPDASAPVAAPTAPAYELVAVRPDWTDGRALLGFCNPLTKSYEPTPTLQLLLRAHAELASVGDAGAPRPYFLIFDEMNLARVEHYFSDFLSAMESGESIHLHDEPQLEEDKDIPRRITIPRNLFVIGTVNIDETTYMFSPKVLDRAFVLEFNDVDLAGLAGEVPAEAATSTPLALDNLEGGLALLGAATDEEWRRFNAALGGEAGAVLRRIHAALALENRHFGYRVAREIARFVGLAMTQAGEGEATVRAALDVAVFSKVLPKLHGSQAEIEGTLKALLAIALGGVTAEEAFDGGVLRAEVVVPLPRTARKLHRMLRRLRAHGFVSFIE